MFTIQTNRSFGLHLIKCFCQLSALVNCLAHFSHVNSFFLWVYSTCIFKFFLAVKDLPQSLHKNMPEVILKINYQLISWNWITLFKWNNQISIWPWKVVNWLLKYRSLYTLKQPNNILWGIASTDGNQWVSCGIYKTLHEFCHKTEHDYETV